MQHLLFASAALALGLAACEGCRASRGPVAASRAADGGPPTVRLYLLTDLAGALEPCGCTRDQLGGLGHLGAWIKQSRAVAPTSLLAEAGPLFFMDERLEPQRAEQDRAKAHAIARVLSSLGFVAFSPGANDWADGAASLTALAREAGGTSLEPGAVVTREAGGLKIAFLGAAPGDPSASAVPVEQAVAHGAAEAKAQGANVLVVLAAVGRGEAKRIADAVPDLTAVVVGSPRAAGEGNSTAPPVERIGDVLIVQAANHLQSVAVLDLYVRGPVAAGKPISFADATGLELAQQQADLAAEIDALRVKLAAWQRDPSIAPKDIDARRDDLARLESQRDALGSRRRAPATGSFYRYELKEVRESLGNDGEIEGDMRAYYKAVDDHNRVAFADRVPLPATPGQASYVGIDTCTSCHADARHVWDETSHAHAYASLSSQFKEYNLDCVSCHVTGYERPGGSTVTHVNKLENVQCEVCHGPGSKHVKNPADSASILAKPNASSCVVCHHPPHVEDFDAVAKMHEILGPGHGMKK
jgi:hypothetical protein